MVDSAYKPNSHASKIAKAETDKPAKKVEQITTSKVIEKKPSMFRRIGEAFTGDDTQTVGQYLMFDVVVPTVKALVLDLVNQGLERKFYGDGRGSSRTGVRTNYSTQFNRPSATSYPGKPSSMVGSSGRREMSERARAALDFNEIILEDRGEGEQVLDVLQEHINEAGLVSVGTLMALVGSTPDFTMEKFGWFDLKQAHVVRVREGYRIELPRPVPLD